MSAPGKLQELARFHGHLGPYVVIGYRAGLLALQTLGARKYFGIRAVITCPDRPPHSCLLDGVQLATGCTLGKRNIELVVGPEISAHFVNTDTGAEAVVTHRAGGIAKIRQVLADESVEVAGLAAWNIPAEDLFDVVVKAGAHDPPSDARPPDNAH